ncbi:hypothetical protein [Mesorhizobium dulcispinae]|uniref:hypothetical protein n=1 Tax=Mesorhizobium dulcispinae TaxID=3072316 RepID=UPI002A23BF33|nr:hypothetical protein [Mesorhizobium sp. VK23D]MDX8521818.1 hypothetical protein [Mesorhizobium sp. VK23D]
MVQFTKFEELDERGFFVAFVKEYYESGWPAANKASGASVTLDAALIDLAFDTYQVSLQQYRVALNSKNPDHYKRAGALLHALYKAAPIVSIEWGEVAERLRNFDNVGVSYDDAQHWDNYVVWWDNYSNYVMAFDLAFRCCQVYEEAPRPYDKDMLDNMAYYMAENTNINVGSFVTILKAFMASA